MTIYQREELERRASNLAWKVGEHLVDSEEYKAILNAMERAFLDGEREGRVSLEQPNSGVRK